MYRMNGIDFEEIKVDLSKRQQLSSLSTEFRGNSNFLFSGKTILCRSYACFLFIFNNTCIGGKMNGSSHGANIVWMTDSVMMS